MSTRMVVAVGTPEEVKDRDGNAAQGAGSLSVSSQRVEKIFPLSLPVSVGSLGELFLKGSMIAKKSELELCLENAEGVTRLWIPTRLLLDEVRHRC